MKNLSFIFISVFFISTTCFANNVSDYNKCVDQIRAAASHAGMKNFLQNRVEGSQKWASVWGVTALSSVTFGNMVIPVVNAFLNDVKIVGPGTYIIPTGIAAASVLAAYHEHLAAACTQEQIDYIVSEEGSDQRANTLKRPAPISAKSVVNAAKKTAISANP